VTGHNACILGPVNAVPSPLKWAFKSAGATAADGRRYEPQLGTRDSSDETPMRCGVKRYYFCWAKFCRQQRTVACVEHSSKNPKYFGFFFTFSTFWTFFHFFHFLLSFQPTWCCVPGPKMLHRCFFYPTTINTEQFSSL
jgi:hypothetical protein